MMKALPKRQKKDLQLDLILAVFVFALIVASVIIYIPYVMLFLIPQGFSLIMKKYIGLTQKQWESIAHIVMGFGAGLTNTRLLLTYREERQLPPENDKHPVVWVALEQVGQAWDWTKAWLGSAYGGEEYWSKARVMDTLKDSREYDIGTTIAWFFVLGLGIIIGLWL